MRYLGKSILWVMMVLLCVSCSQKKADVAADVNNQPTSELMTVKAKIEPQTPPAPGAPAVQVDVPSHNFGRVSEGEDYIYGFVVKNVGTGVLQIKKVLPGCGSSVAAFDKEIPPGGQGVIKIRLNPKSCTETKKTALVVTNDPVRTHFMLDVYAQFK